jgi:hypothetical protein
LTANLAYIGEGRLISLVITVIGIPRKGLCAEGSCPAGVPLRCSL